jgi:hypothetical protein
MLKVAQIKHHISLTNNKPIESPNVGNCTLLISVLSALS